jgi:hypothetical protein
MTMTAERRQQMDTTPLREAFRSLLDAAAAVTDHGDASPVPPPGEWNAEQILAHVSLVSAATIAAIGCVAAGANTTYDNRIALDTWTIDHVIALADGYAGLRDRIRRQADALCAVAGPMLSDAELDTPVPTRLVSKATVLADQAMPLRGLITGLAETELPGHTAQLLALVQE